MTLCSVAACDAPPEPTPEVAESRAAPELAPEPTPEATPEATHEAKTESAPNSEHERASDKPPIYDEHADNTALVERALAQASAERKRVLLMFGGNWCGWCHKLHELFESDASIREALARDYVLVMIDSHHGETIAARFEVPLDEGVPFLTVLDAQGGVVTRQETGSLEDGPRHDPAKVLAFLQQHAPSPA